jgi:hypothetical protein
LRDPFLHRENRARLADQEVPVNRGSAGTSVGTHLLALLKGASQARAQS